MKTILIILLIIVLSAPAYADYKFAENWTRTDTAYQATFLAITTVDWMQTQWMAKNNWQWDGEYHSEFNPILGSHPHQDKVNVLIPLGMVAHTGIAMALPPDLRRAWQCIFIGIESLSVARNYSVGVQLEF